MEYAYAKHSMPRHVLGINAAMFKAFLRDTANRCARQMGRETLFSGKQNLAPWISEMSDLKQEHNFFETRVIEYPSGGAISWD